MYKKKKVTNPVSTGKGGCEVPWRLHVGDLIGVETHTPSLIHKKSGGFQ
jgi:hypothetical protein